MQRSPSSGAVQRSPSSGALPPLQPKPLSSSSISPSGPPGPIVKHPDAVPVEQAAPGNGLYSTQTSSSSSLNATGSSGSLKPSGSAAVGEMTVTAPLLLEEPAVDGEDAVSVAGSDAARPSLSASGQRRQSRSPLYSRVSRSPSQADVSAGSGGARRASVAREDSKVAPKQSSSFLRKPTAMPSGPLISNLTELNVSGQSLQTCPDLGPYLSNLITLDISKNQIQSLHKSFERLSSLTALKAASNILKEIPATIGRITSLEYLDFSGNILSQVPSSVGWLENLHTFLLAGNQIAKIPADLERCRKLDNLELAGNKLLSIPTFILRNTIGLGRDFIEETIPLETMNGLKASHKTLSERAKKAIDKAASLEQQVAQLLESQKTAESELVKLRTQFGDIVNKAQGLERESRSEAAEKDRLLADAGAAVEKFTRELQRTEAALRAERTEVQSLAAKLVALEERLREARESGGRPDDDDGVVPPTGTVTLVFTDIQGSTAQWESNAKLMAPALKQHNKLMRARIKAWKGYEVKTEGDAFMIAFTSALDAARFCLDVQVELTKEAWDPELLKNPESAVEEDEEGGGLLWRGLRVRMGCHTGEPSAEPDPTTKRMDYFGPMVNRAARVEGVCNGGQITLSSTVMRALEEHLPELKKEAVFKPLGEVQLKGLETPEFITQMLPKSLGKRTFPPIGKPSAAQTATEQIKEMQAKNQAILEKLRAMESIVENVRGEADVLASRIRRYKSGGGSVKDASGSQALTEAAAKFETLLSSVTKLRQQVGDEVKDSRDFRDKSKETEKTALRALKAENERVSAQNQQLAARLAKVEEHSKQNGALKAEVKRLTAAVAELEANLQAKTAEAEGLAAEVKRRDHLLADTEGKSKEKSEYIQGAVFEIRELEAELARTTARVFALQGEKAEVEKGAAELREELANARSRAEEGAKGKGAAEDDLTAARKRIAELEEEVRGAEERLELATLRYSSEMSALRGDLHERTKEATRSRAEALRNGEQLRAAHAELPGLKAEVATLRAGTEALRKQLEAALASNRELEHEKRDRRQMSTQLDQKNAVIKAVAQDRAEKTKELQDALEAARGAELRAAQAEAVVASLQAALQAAEAAKQAAEGEAGAARAAAAAAGQEAAGLQAELDALRAMASDADVRPARDALLAKRGVIAELKELLQFYVREHRLQTPAQAQELARALRAVMSKYLDPNERLLMGLGPSEAPGPPAGGVGSLFSSGSGKAGAAGEGSPPQSKPPRPGSGAGGGARKTIAHSSSKASIAPRQ